VSNEANEMSPSTSDRFLSVVIVFLLVGFLISLVRLPLTSKRSARSERPVAEILEELNTAILDFDATEELVGTPDYVKRHDEAFSRAFSAVHELAAMGPRAIPAIPVLVEIMDGPRRDHSSHDMSLQAEISGAISLIGRFCVPEQIDALTADDPKTRKAAAKTLGATAGRFQEIAQESIVPLTQAIDDEDASVRLAAIHAISSFGPRARVAVPALKRALKDDDPQVREIAALVLKYVDPTTAAQVGVK
jgi:hypothetical protein